MIEELEAIAEKDAVIDEQRKVIKDYQAEFEAIDRRAYRAGVFFFLTLLCVIIFILLNA